MVQSKRLERESATKRMPRIMVAVYSFCWIPRRVAKNVPSPPPKEDPKAVPLCCKSMEATRSTATPI